ncbi:MAG: AsmA family protein [Gammaproteobacteria bacterium]|nr:AsmA family protein [Gammaproteobacteria bacterium]
MGILVVLVIGIVVAISLVDINQYKDELIKLVEDKTGREFTIDGELKIGVSLIPTVVVEGVKFGNAKWGSKPDMLSVDHFEAQVSLMPLLNRNIQVNRLILISPEILLETDKNGVGNWVLKTKEAKEAPPDAGKTAPSSLPAFTINNVLIENGGLTYKDGISGKTSKISISKFNVVTPSFSDPVELLLSAAYNEMPISVEGTLGSLDSLIENSNFSLNIKADISNAKLSIDGKLAKPTQGKGLDADLTFQTDSLAAFEKLADRKLPALAPIAVSGHVTEQEGAYLLKGIKANLAKLRIGLDGKVADPKKVKGLDLALTFAADSLSDLNEVTDSKLPALGPISLSTRLTDKDNAYHLGALKLQAGDSDLAGDVTLNITGKHPALSAKLNSNKIDLTVFESKEKGEKDKQKKVKKEKIFSSDPLPLESLKSADASLDINAKQIHTTDLLLENVKLALTLNNGKLAVKPLNANLAGGTLSTNLNLDASGGKTAVMDTNVDIKNFQPSALPDLKDKLTGGKTDIKLNAKGSGNSISAIMAGLNGNLLLTMGEGKLKSSETDAASSDVFLKTYRMLNPKASGSQDTQIKCGVVKFDIKDGIATTDKGIALATDKMNVIGSGTVNLKTEALDIGVTPQAREGVGISAGQLAELVRLQGTLANPEAGIDTKAAVMAGVSAGAAVATGGLSILAQGLFDRATAEEDPCALALGLKTAKSAPEKKKEEAPKSVTEKATDTVKDAGTAIKDTFKGLFD